jgi:hypothetical protein
VGGCYRAAHRVAGESGVGLWFSLGRALGLNEAHTGWVAAIRQLAGLQVRVGLGCEVLDSNGYGLVTRLVRGQGGANAWPEWVGAIGQLTRLQVKVLHLP